MSVERIRFGAAGGTPVDRFRLTGGPGVTAELSSYGATLVALRVPDRDGRSGDVVLGFDGLEGYLGGHPHLGGIVGRYANRIGNASFPLDGRRLELTANDPPHHIHGGEAGFDRMIWRAESFHEPGAQGVRFSHVSADGDQGYPGELRTRVGYTLRGSELVIDYEAESNAPTVVNLTNHAYFNLRDAGASSVLDHVLEIPAHLYTPVDAAGIPTGAIASVQGTALDFRSPRALGERLDQLGDGRGGYDHNYVLDGLVPDGSEPGLPALRVAARVFEPESGRTLVVRTSQPGLQLYSGNFLDGSVVGRGDVAYRAHHGLCLETQHFPDSPNQPGFPSTRLDPGQRYRHRTVIRFGTR
jgi:aldose 1-epimerase